MSAVVDHMVEEARHREELEKQWRTRCWNEYQEMRRVEGCALVRMRFCDPASPTWKTLWDEYIALSNVADSFYERNLA